MSAPAESKGRVVLVTGGLGYLGSALLRRLAAAPLEEIETVRILDSGSGQALMSLRDLPATLRFEYVEGDIFDRGLVAEALDGVRAVVHLAGVVVTPFSFEHPSRTHQVNHWGTAQLVEACIAANVRRFIFASSGSVYGPGGPHREQDPCRPVGPYAESKRAAEQAVEAARERGLFPTTLRLGLLYGIAPGFRMDGVINKFAFRAATGAPLIIYGSGEQMRPILHVEDAAEAVRFALGSPQLTADGVFNVVEQNASISDMAGEIREIVPRLQLRHVEQDFRTRISLALEGSLYRKLGWNPVRELKNGIGEIVMRLKNVQPMPRPKDREDLIRLTEI